MKKLLTVLLLIASILVIVTIPVAAAEITVTVNNRAVVFTDSNPFIDANGRTLVPLRPIAEAMGLNVEWDETSREARFSSSASTVVFTIGSKVASHDGTNITMDTAAVIVNGRTYAPIRYLAEAMGYSVDWDAVSQTVTLKKSSEIQAVRDFQANYTSTWAKTPTHFFFTNTKPSESENDMLYCLSLNDITQVQEVDVPGDGVIEILGVNDEYLFVSRRSGDWGAYIYATYSFPLATLQAKLIGIGQYSGVPRYHAASNSILFPYRNLDQRIVWLEALYLDTGECHKIYEFKSNNFDASSGWWQMKDGAVVFINSSWGAAEQGSDFILINSQLQAKQIQSSEISESYPQLHLGEDSALVQELMKKNKALFKLYSINNILFATLHTGVGEDAEFVEAVMLQNDTFDTV